MDLLQHSPCGHILAAPDGTIQFASAAFLALAGIAAGSLTGRRFQDSLTRGGAIFYETQFVPTLLLRGFLNEISFDLITPGDAHTPVFVSAILRREETGEPGSILMAVMDATQRRLYEKELLRARKDSEQVAEVVRRSSDAIIRLGPDGSIHGWNNGAERIFGYSPTEAIGQPLSFLFGDKGIPEIESAIAKLERGAEVNRELAGFHKSGRAVDVSMSMTPHLEAPGILVAFSAIIRDITARKQSEKALLQSEKLASVGRLASSIAHEINNPLESVTNLLYILGTRGLDEGTRELVKMAQEELSRVSQIATHTLRFHKQSSSRTLLDVVALADSVIALYRARLQNSGITFVNDSREVPPLLCFEGEMRQILLNLVANSFDAMRSGGRLTLRNSAVTLWRTGARGVRITVADTGPGMDPETLRQIFEPFFSTKGIGGTGLGLWITQGLVEKNQGTIKVRSSTRPEMSGTVVSMLFPHISS